VEKYDFLALRSEQKGTSSPHREMERPSKQVAWGEEKLDITDTDGIYAEGNMENIFSIITSLVFLEKLRMYISVQIVRLKKFRSMLIYSNSFMMYSLGHMKRF
jgi:hypothetical protein